MDEAEGLIALCVRALVAQMSEAPGFELHMTRTCALALTDEPLADFNVLTLGPDPDAEGFLRRAVARARARGRPLVATMSPHVAPALAPVAAGLGLTPVGTAPLMVLRTGSSDSGTRYLSPTLASATRATGIGILSPAAPVRVVRALGPELVRIAGDLVAAAFDAPRDAVARCIDPCVSAAAGVETHIAWAGDQPVSAVTVTPSGDTAGITLMATPPPLQRRGFGRALLTQVIDDYRRRGVERFYLGATAAGRPLYASLGFETVAELSAWLLA
ncbi:GNAT family N-acetyltransferase [Caulobacter sp. KR2-114]|uniref:GNAT family N-acetyltransferase n=1 Tax=Caulobacter sp. KR2-114 TaxID=3400912 RepID=UPI003C0AD3BA